jgi:N-acyl-D-aspartate/D-glutamate deacylase
MKNTIIILSIFLISCNQSNITIDTLVKDGKILDGSGEASFIGDIGIRADTIVFVGNSDEYRLQVINTIDATGLTVSPGFIDPHTHAEVDLTSEDGNSNINYLMQGVTTVFVGNDGGGPFDIEAASSNLNSRGIGTNVAFFVGHGTVRNEVIGREDVSPDSAQLASMKSLVRQGMQTGAFGLSTGLYYVPGSYATTEEVIALTKEIVPFGGRYDSHIRDESSYNIGLINAVKEVLEIGEKSGAPVHFGHIKALGVDVWGKSQEIIDLIEEAQSKGIIVTADQYPWNASGTRLQNALVNNWVKAGGDEVYYQRLGDQSLLPKINSEIKENIRKRGGAASLLITGGYIDESIIGMNLQQISEKWEMDEVAAALRICKNGGARIASFNMNEEDIENFMVQDWVMTSSDGSTGHPRKYASYPRKFQKYVLENEVISLEEFVYKSSALVANTFGITKRGMLKDGFYADIIIFDEDKFKAIANFSEPELLSEGIEYVWVNGDITIEKGTRTNKLKGRVLKKTDR